MRADPAAEGLDRIVKAALTEVPERGTILIGAGAVTARLAEALPPERPLTVVTNAVPIALALADRPRGSVVVIGGRLDGRGSAADAWALEELASLSAEVAFLTADGLSVRRGLSAPDLAGAAVGAAMIGAARRTVLLAGRAALGLELVARVADVADIDVLITAADLDDETTAAIAARGPQVVRA